MEEENLIGLETDDLLDMFTERTAALKTAKQAVGAVEEVIVSRMEDDGVNWLVKDENEFTINHPRKAVQDKDFLIGYLDEDWALVLPLTNPRMKALKELIMRRGDDVNVVMEKVFTTKFSRKLKIGHLPLDWDEDDE